VLFKRITSSTDRTIADFPSQLSKNAISPAVNFWPLGGLDPSLISIAYVAPFFAAKISQQFFSWEIISTDQPSDRKAATISFWLASILAALRIDKAKHGIQQFFFSTENFFPRDFPSMKGNPISADAVVCRAQRYSFVVAGALQSLTSADVVNFGGRIIEPVIATDDTAKRSDF